MGAPINFNTDKCTLRVMHVSSAHAPGEDALKDESFGPMYEGAGGFGYIYYVPVNFSDLHDCNPPAWLFPILIKAHEFNYDYVLIDGDGPIFLDFKTYSWWW